MDTGIAFWASRYGKSTDGTDDYLNCPFDREQYERFVDELLQAQAVSAHIAEDDTPVFRSLPAHRGAGAARPRHAALRPHEAHGPDRSAHRPAALGRGAASPGEPARRQLQPGGLPEPPEVRRAGAHPAPDSGPGAAPSSCASARSIATPTSTRPALLTPTLQLRARPRGFLRRADFGRGRLRGIHRHRADGGHARRRAGGGRRAARRCRAQTALGSLCHYVSGADPAHYQPANITFDLLPPLDEATRQRLRRDKQARHAEVCRRAQAALEEYLHAYA